MRLLLAIFLVAPGAFAAPGDCPSCARVCSARNKAKYQEICDNCLKECASTAPQAGSTAAAETGTPLQEAAPAAAPVPGAPKRRSRRRGAAEAPAVAAPAEDPPPKSCGRNRETGEEDFSCLDEENLARRLQFEKAVQAKVVGDPVCDPIGDRFDARRCELASERHAGAIARIEKLVSERRTSKPNPCQDPEMGDEEYCRQSCGECGLASDGRYLPMGKFTTKARDELRRKGKVLKPVADTPEAKAEAPVPFRQEDCLSQNQEVCERGCARLPETGRPPNQMTCKSSCRRKAASFCKAAPVGSRIEVRSRARIQAACARPLAVLTRMPSPTRRTGASRRSRNIPRSVPMFPNSRSARSPQMPWEAAPSSGPPAMSFLHQEQMVFMAPPAAAGPPS